MSDVRKELLPCPFCGGRPHGPYQNAVGTHSIRCRDCGANVALGLDGNGKWNRRAALSALPEDRSVGEAVRQYIDEQPFRSYSTHPKAHTSDERNWQIGFTDGVNAVCEDLAAIVPLDSGCPAGCDRGRIDGDGCYHPDCPWGDAAPGETCETCGDDRIIKVTYKSIPGRHPLDVDVRHKPCPDCTDTEEA